MPSLRLEQFQSARRWLLPATLLALAPKCVLCALAYAGLGAAWGLGGPELCGAPANEAPHAWANPFALLGMAAGVGALGWWLKCRRLRPPPTPVVTN